MTESVRATELDQLRGTVGLRLAAIGLMEEGTQVTQGKGVELPASILGIIIDREVREILEEGITSNNLSQLKDRLGYLSEALGGHALGIDLVDVYYEAGVYPDDPYWPPHPFLEDTGGFSVDMTNEDGEFEFDPQKLDEFLEDLRFAVEASKTGTTQQEIEKIDQEMRDLTQESEDSSSRDKTSSVAAGR